MLLPSYCGYVTETYRPTRKEFLVAPIHNKALDAEFFDEVEVACEAINCRVVVKRLRDVYRSYDYSNLVSHQGIIYVPYQVSIIFKIFI